VAFRLHNEAAVSVVRAARCHYCFRWLREVTLLLGFVVLLGAGGCGRAVPDVEAATKSAEARGTISGTVRASEAGMRVAGRTVEIVNLATGERRTAITSDTGGFAFELPAGEYRLDLALRDGEMLVKRPDVVVLDKGDRDSHVELVMAAARVLRPRGPAYRVDNGLGAPSA
jgi:RNase P/RNase MRP subunit p29